MSRKNLLMVLFGVFLLLFFGPLYPLATIVVDTAPPTFVSTTPFAKSLGYLSSFTTASAKVSDSGSGVKSVLYIDEVMLDAGATPKSLTYSSANDLWTGSVSSYTYNVGTDYYFEFTATDNAGNTQHLTGVFTIYNQLIGDWYVNNQKITSSSQTVYSKSRGVSFKFVKTEGLSDGSITCKVSWTGPNTGSITLTNTASGTWTGSHTFAADGQYDVQLSASDGIGTPITLSVLGIGFGGTGLNYYQVFGVSLGLFLIGYGWLAERKRAGA